MEQGAGTEQRQAVRLPKPVRAVQTEGVSQGRGPPGRVRWQFGEPSREHKQAWLLLPTVPVCMAQFYKGGPAGTGALRALRPWGGSCPLPSLFRSTKPGHHPTESRRSAAVDYRELRPHHLAARAHRSQPSSAYVLYTTYVRRPYDLRVRLLRGSVGVPSRGRSSRR